METAAQGTRVSRAHFVWLRRLGTLLMVAGVCGLAWAFVTWQWNDPFTAVYTRWQQGRLEAQYRAVVQREASRPPLAPPEADPLEALAAVRKAARRYRASAQAGGAIGRIVVPRLGLDMIFVNGTESAVLKKGPGRDARTFMPGEGELVYIAGHRTTYLAPFAHIDRMRPGDHVTLEMPYATFVYRVTGHRIVEADDLSVLRSHGREVVALQACHPRFFATNRYIVWGRLVRVTPQGRTAFTPAP